MVSFTIWIWYHFPRQYGTIFSFKMVPFSIAIWYHILLGFRPYWKSRLLICLFKISLFQSQKGYGCFTPVVRGRFWSPRKNRKRRQKRSVSVGNNTMNTRRCVDLFVTQGLRPRKANASAKHVKGCTTVESGKWHRRYPINKRARTRGILLWPREKSLDHRRFCVGPLLDRYLYPMCNDRIVDSLCFN